MVNVKFDLQPATLAFVILSYSARLAFVASAFKGILLPLTRLPVLPSSTVLLSQAALPVRVLLSVSRASDQRFSDVRLVLFGEDSTRLQPVIRVLLQFDVVFFQAIKNHSFSNPELLCDLSHRHGLVHGFQHVARRIECPTASDFPDCDPMLMEGLTDRLRAYTVHLSYLLTGLELVELLKLWFC